MTLLSLTSFNQIRGVLTVSEADLPDETLTAYGLEDDLSVDLDEWAGEWQGIVEAGGAIEPPPSAESVKQFKLLRLYAKYFCAAQVAATAPVFVLKKNTDGSNEGQRSDKDGFLWLSNLLSNKASQYKTALIEALGEEEPAAGVMTFTSRVTPTRDPVTEAREDALG